MSQEKSSWFWPGVSVLILAWSFAAVVWTGWPWAWGLIPGGTEAAVWVIPVSLFSTILLLAALSGKTSWFDKEIICPIPLGRLFSERGNYFLRSTAAGILFILTLSIGWYLRSRNHFMGDGWAWIGSVEKPFSFQRNEPLDFFLHQSFYHLLKLIHPAADGEAAYAVLHCLLLPFYLLIVWNISSLVSKDTFERWVLWLLLISTGSLQFYFGYVENYAIVYLCLSLYILLSIKYLQVKKYKKPWLPSVLFILAAATHVSAIVLAPSLIYLWLQRFGPESSTGITSWNSRLVGLISLVLFIAAIFFFDPNIMVPVWGEVQDDTTAYHMFELKHLWDKFNFFLLAAPSVIVLLILVISKAKVIVKSKNTVLAFILWCSAGASFFTFVYNPVLGIRDWDVLGLPGLPLTLLTGLLIMLFWPEGIRRRLFISALALICWTHVMIWIWVNSDMNRGVRFLDRVCRAEYHNGANRIQLSSLLDKKGYPKTAIKMLRYTEGGEWPLRAFISLSKLFLYTGLPDSTIIYSRRVLSEYNFEKDITQNLLIELSIAYDLIGMLDSAAVYYVDAMQIERPLDKNNRIFWIHKMQSSAMHYKYNSRLQTGSVDVPLLLFYLRYFTLTVDNEKLKLDYSFILESQFSERDWLKFIQFARVSGQSDYRDLIIQRARKFYPLINISP